MTSALAAAARLRVSLTHRDAARSVRFVTGHARSGRLPDDLDWRILADPRTTLVVYMGGRTSHELARRLVAEGLPPSTPARVALAVTHPEERILATDLAGLAQGPIEVAAPVLIVIGEVVRDALGDARSIAGDREDRCNSATGTLARAV